MRRHSVGQIQGQRLARAFFRREISGAYTDLELENDQRITTHAAQHVGDRPIEARRMEPTPMIVLVPMITPSVVRNARSFLNRMESAPSYAGANRVAVARPSVLQLDAV